MECSARDRPTHRSRRSFIRIVCVVAVSVLAAAPAIAQAASRSRASTARLQVSAGTAGSASICSKVSNSTVSAIVGYTVPAATAETRHLQPTAANFGISAVETTCTFGSQASLAALIKDVSLTFEVTSRALTAQEVKTQIAKATSATIKISVTPYPGLGVPALYFTVTGGGTSGAGIVGLSGTTYFGASSDAKLSKSKLASLAKLAQSL